MASIYAEHSGRVLGSSLTGAHVVKNASTTCAVRLTIDDVAHDVQPGDMVEVNVSSVVVIGVSLKPDRFVGEIQTAGPWVPPSHMKSQQEKHQ